MIPPSLATDVAPGFMRSRCRTVDLFRAVRMPLDEMRAMAGAYRTVMRAIRDPERLNRELDDQIGRLL
jgi:hypothetical protein